MHLPRRHDLSPHGSGWILSLHGCRTHGEVRVAPPGSSPCLPLGIHTAVSKLLEQVRELAVFVPAVGNISEVSFHRWKRQFGQMDLDEARKLKEPERENGELKRMLAEALLQNGPLEAVAKNGRPGASQTSGPRGGGARAVLRAGGVSHPAALMCYFLVSASAADLDPAATGQAAADFERKISSPRLPAHRCPLIPFPTINRKVDVHVRRTSPSLCAMCLTNNSRHPPSEHSSFFMKDTSRLHCFTPDMPPSGGIV